MATAWLEVAVGTARPALAEAALETAGAVAVTLRDAGDQPLYEPGVGETPMWRETEVVGLFPPDTDPEGVDATLADAFAGEPPVRRVRLLEDRDWVRAWMDDYRPMRFGQRLWVCPREAAVPAKDAVTLRLDPGLAFGTGTHPTTALCLEWLDAHPPAGCRVLDYGCGSGILAVAAALLGATDVTAADIDPQALTATRENAEANAVDAQRLQVGTPNELADTAVDILIANILAAPLIDLAPRFARRVVAGGRLVLSGVLEEQAASVRAAYAPWFDFSAGAEREGWRRLDAVRNRLPADG